MKSCCCVCKEEFKEGDILQAKFALPGEPLEWNHPVPVDAGFQERFNKNRDKFSRKHLDCKDDSVPNRP